MYTANLYCAGTRSTAISNGKIESMLWKMPKNNETLSVHYFSSGGKIKKKPTLFKEGHSLQGG